jgi:hypothetical protein
VPKPTSVTIPPFFNEALIAVTVPSSALPAAALEMSADFATASMISNLFTWVPFRYSLPGERIRKLFPTAGRRQKNYF